MGVDAIVSILPARVPQKLREDDIAFIVARMQAALVAARRPHETEAVRLHRICAAAVTTTMDIVGRYPRGAHFDVTDGLGEIRESLLGVIEAEYRQILTPEPTAGLIQTLTLSTGGLMLRAAIGLLGANPEAEVDVQMAALMRCVA